MTVVATVGSSYEETIVGCCQSVQCHYGAHACMCFVNVICQYYCHMHYENLNTNLLACSPKQVCLQTVIYIYTGNEGILYLLKCSNNFANYTSMYYICTVCCTCVFSKHQIDNGNRNQEDLVSESHVIKVPQVIMRHMKMIIHVEWA